MEKKWTLQDLRTEMLNQAKHGATNDNAAEEEMERKLERILSAPVTAMPTGTFRIPMSMMDVFIGSPSVTDWNDNDIGPRKCYNLFRMKKDRDIVALGDEIFEGLRTKVSSRAICKLMLLAFQLVDGDGNKCFGHVSHLLISEKVEFDDATDVTLLIPANPARVYVGLSCDDPDREFKVARAYSYLAASYMRFFTKPVMNYQKIGDLVKNRFKDFYDFKFPFEDHHLSVDMLSSIKKHFDFSVTLKNTFYNFLYAGEGSEIGAQLKEFLYRSHTVYTGLHAYTLFLKCMEVHKVSNTSLTDVLNIRAFERELNAIAAIFNNLSETQGQRGKEKQMWKFARIFNNNFFSDLQTKKCTLFTASLAYLYHTVVPIKENENALNITAIRDMHVNQRNMAKAIARVANQKIQAME